MEVFAFAPSEAEYTLVDGYIVSFYDTSLENPYSVNNIDEKVRECIDMVSMDSYNLHENEAWIEIKYESIKNGNPKRL